jgi:hypothetical protein
MYGCYSVDAGVTDTPCVTKYDHKVYIAVRCHFISGARAKQHNLIRIGCFEIFHQIRNKRFVFHCKFLSAILAVSAIRPPALFADKQSRRLASLLTQG